MAKNISTLRKLLLLLLLAVPLAAASIYLFKTLNARVGLNSSQINCILKDSRGFVWQDSIVMMATPLRVFSAILSTVRRYLTVTL